MRVQIAVIVMLALFLGGCASTSETFVSIKKDWVATVLTIEAEVQTVDGESSVVILTESKCDSHPDEMGCVEVKAGTIGIIQFILDGGEAESCEGQTDDTWVWKDIQLTAMSNVDISRAGVTKKVGSISSTAQFDFGAKSSGEISAATIDGQQMVIRDMNSAEYDIWYTLYAHQCGNATNTATSDPRVKNHGDLDTF